MQGKYLIKQDHISSEKLMHGLFVISITFGVLLHFNASSSGIFTKFFLLVSFITGFLGVSIYYFQKNSSNKKFLNLWLFLVIYMLIVGAINNKFGIVRNSDFIWIFSTQDIRYVVYFAMGIVYAEKLFIERYNKLMIYLGIISVIFAIFALFFSNLKVSEISQRQGIWSLPYYFWWLSCAVFAYVFPYTQITGKYRWVGYSVLASYGGLGLIFQKRAAVVNVFVIIFITLLLKPNKNNTKSRGSGLYRIIIFSILLLIIFLISGFFVDKNSYIGQLISSIYDRFIGISYLSNFDRTDEAMSYFNSVNPIYIIFGQGIGNYIYTTRLINSLHTGLFNLLYKGGIFYFAMYIAIFLKTVKAYINRDKLSEQGLICLCTVIASLVSLLYEFSWGYTIEIFGYAMATAYIYNIEYKQGELT